MTKGIKIKDNVDLNQLREFGFRLGKEWADAGERCLEGIGYQYQHGWWHKFLMDPDDKSKILYADDDYDQPLVRITVRTEYRDLYVDCTPSGTYHIGGEDLDIILETIYDLAKAGLIEKNN